MKLVAQVVTVLRQVNKIGAIVDGEVRPVGAMPLPAWVEIVPETAGGPWMMIRYTAAGEECGDTWHESLDNAFVQAAYEYGLAKSDFREVDQTEAG